jgi:hypothetical protein
VSRIACGSPDGRRLKRLRPRLVVVPNTAHGKCGDSPDARLMCGGPGTATPTTVTFRAARPIDLLETASGLEDGVNQIVGLNRFGFAWSDFPVDVVVIDHIDEMPTED